jgi:hypothetical protein
LRGFLATVKEACEVCINPNESAVRKKVEHVVFEPFHAPKPLLSLAAPALELIRHQLTFSALLRRYFEHTIRRALVGILSTTL